MNQDDRAARETEDLPEGQLAAETIRRAAAQETEDLPEKQLAAAIRSHRKRRHLTQVGLADAAGIHPRTVTAYESGKVRIGEARALPFIEQALFLEPGSLSLGPQPPRGAGQR